MAVAWLFCCPSTKDASKGPGRPPKPHPLYDMEIHDVDRGYLSQNHEARKLCPARIGGYGRCNGWRAHTILIAKETREAKGTPLCRSIAARGSFSNRNRSMCDLSCCRKRCQIWGVRGVGKVPSRDASVMHTSSRVSLHAVSLYTSQEPALEALARLIPAPDNSGLDC